VRRRAGCVDAIQLQRAREPGENGRLHSWGLGYVKGLGIASGTLATATSNSGLAVPINQVVSSAPMTAGLTGTCAFALTIGAWAHIRQWLRPDLPRLGVVRVGCGEVQLMSLVALVVGILGVWRVTHLVSAEERPWRSVREAAPVPRAQLRGQAVECFDCLSLWVAIPFAFALGATWLDRLLWWPALSGGAMAIYRAVSRVAPDPVALYIEDPPEETSHVQTAAKGRAVSPRTRQTAGHVKTPRARRCRRDRCCSNTSVRPRLTVFGAVTRTRYRFPNPGAACPRST
jgi:hypothetical protein